MKPFPRLNPKETALLVVDVQERLVPAMFEAERVVRQCSLLARAASQLQLPVVVSEQNAAKLGATVPLLAQTLGEHSPIEKMRFSACVPELIEALEKTGRRSVILCGLETHICITQSALDLRARDFAVFVASNAVSSRYESDKSAGLARLSSIGCVLGSVEMFVYELLEEAGTADFRALLPHLK